MAEGAVVYQKTLPPHIRGARSLPKRFWGQLIALIPLFIAACFTRHAEILRVLSVCLVSAVTFEIAAVKILSKKENLRNGETVLTATLFAFLMPSRCPAEIVILGVFMAVFVAQELFGGTGSYLFHPVILARVFLQISFPKIMGEPMLLAGEGHVGILIGISLGAIGLFKQRQGYWETPFLFMAVCFIWEVLFGGRETPLMFFSGVLFAAFFLFADPVTMPLTRQGTRIFVLGAAVLSASLGGEGFSIGTAACAILLMDLLTPWLDLWLKPVALKTKEMLKATYPT